MKSFLVAASIVLMGSILSSSCATSGRMSGSSSSDEFKDLGLQFQLKEKRLKNGLRILIVEDSTVPIVSYQTWVNVGSVDEKFGLTGLAHLFEHLMFKGSRNFGPRAFFQELESKGAAVNAYTTRDYTVYHETFTKSLLPRVIELEADRLSGLQLNDEVLYIEKQVVAEERRLRTENSPDGRMQEALWGLSYRAHPYRWPVIGYSEDLNRVTVEDLQAFFAEYYQPGNITLVITGDVNAAEVFAAVEEKYGNIPGKKRERAAIPREPEQKEPRTQVIPDEVSTLRVAFGYPITSAAETDTHSLDILSTILFNGVSSRAYQRLVDQKKISLNVNGIAYTPLYPGLFMLNSTLYGGATVEDFEKEWESIVAEIQEKGVTAEELSMAVRQLTMQTVDSVRTAHGLGTLIGTVTAILGEPELYKDDLVKYQKVNSSDVIRVAKKYLVTSRKNRVIMRQGVVQSEENQ